MAEKEKRRTRGDGSFYQRADGMWMGRVELPPKDGKRRYRWVSSKDRNTAIAKLKKVRADVDSGRIAVTNSATVETWLNRWITDIHADHLHPNTQLLYRATIDNHIVPAIGSKRMEKLTPDHIRDMRDHIGRSRTAVLAHQILKKALKDAIREGMVTRNVASLVDEPTYAKKKRTSMSVAVAKRVLETADSSCDESQAARWWAAFFTGARQSELLGLRWDYVDLDAGLMDISWQLQRLRKTHGCGDPKTVDGKTVYPCGKVRVGWCSTGKWDLPPDFEFEPCQRSHLFTRPKSQAGIRLVPIVKPLLDRLTALHDNQGTNPHNLVWHVNGNPVDDSDDSRRWHELLRTAGVLEAGKTIPLHTARHTTATLLRAAGVDEQTRMEILGHATVDSQRVYAHADRERHELAMSNLNELLS